MRNSNINRRRFLQATAAGLAGSTILGSQSALAESKQVIMATWGGDYSRLLTELVSPLVDSDAGVSVVHDTGSTSARRTKVIAQAKRPQNAIDLISFSETDMFLMGQKGYLAEVNVENVPNFANVLPQFQQKYSIPHIYSALVIVYNPDLVPEPTSYKDLWSEPFHGKVGLANALYRNAIRAATYAHGGNDDDYGPGYEALLELKEQGVKVLPSNEAIANALKSGEIGATLMWRARAVQWKNAGLPVKSAVPSEGAMPVVFEAAATQNSANPAEAAAVLNAMLDPVAQAAFAQEMGYIPTVSNAELPAEVAAEIGFTDAERNNFLPPHHETVIAKTPEMLEWWNQTFKA